MAAYESYGSLSTLKQQVESIRTYVKGLSDRRKGEKFLPEEFQFGDWCDPDAPVDRPWLSKVKAQFVANAFFANTVQLAADVEALAGDAAHQKEYTELAATLRKDIWEHFGAEAKETTAGCSIALEFGIVPESEHAAVAQILSDKVIADQGKITTGFLVYSFSIVTATLFYWFYYRYGIDYISEDHWHFRQFVFDYAVREIIILTQVITVIFGLIASWYDKKYRKAYLLVGLLILEFVLIGQLQIYKGP
jgi:hypothetical protein